MTYIILELDTLSFVLLLLLLDFETEIIVVTKETHRVYFLHSM